MHRQTTFKSAEKNKTEYLPTCSCMDFEWYKLAKNQYEILQKLDFQIEAKDVWLYQKRYHDRTVYFAVPDIAPHYGASVYEVNAEHPEAGKQFNYENGIATFTPSYQKEIIKDLDFNVQGGNEDLAEMYAEMTYLKYGYYDRAPEIPDSGIKDCRAVHEKNKAAYADRYATVKAMVHEVTDKIYESPTLR